MALALMMRRALSSERGFLGFLDLGFGRSGWLPSLRDQGSGLTDEEDGFTMIFILTLVVVLGFVEVEVEVKDFKAVVLDWEQWEESSGLVVHRKEEEYVSDSISEIGRAHV